MSSERKCCAPGCIKKIDIQTALHRFPNPAKDMDRFKTWLYNIGGEIMAHSFDYIYKYRRVCRSHFEAKYHYGRNRISRIAVPTLNLPGLLIFKKKTSTNSIKSNEKEIDVPSSAQERHVLKRMSKCNIPKQILFNAVELMAEPPNYIETSSKQAAAMRSIRKIITNPQFLEALDNIPNSGRLVTQMQIRQNRKKNIFYVKSTLWTQPFWKKSKKFR